MAVSRGNRFWNDEAGRSNEYDLTSSVKRQMKHGQGDTPATSGLETGFTIYDAGMTYNHERGESIYEPGDIMHYHATAPNGVRVHVEKRAASLNPNGHVLYRVAYGANPSMPSTLLTRDEAISDLASHDIYVEL